MWRTKRGVTTMAKKTTKSAPRAPSLIERTLKLEPFRGLDAIVARERYQRERWTLTKRVRAYNELFGTNFKPAEVLYRKYAMGSALSPSQKAILSLPTTGVKRDESGEIIATKGQAAAMVEWAKRAKTSLTQFLNDTGLMSQCLIEEAEGGIAFYKFMMWVVDKAEDLRGKTPTERASFYADPSYDEQDNEDTIAYEDDDSEPLPM